MGDYAGLGRTPRAGPIESPAKLGYANRRGWGFSKERNMRKILTASALLAALALMACNTVEGAGRDISAAGHAISNTASDVIHH